MLRQGVVFWCGTTRTTVLYFFPRSFPCSFFASCASLAFIYDYLKKKKLPIDQAIPEAIFMLYGQFHEREFLLVSYWREWCFESCGNCLSRRRVQWNWDEYVFLRFFFILFIRQINWQTLNLCPSPVFETLFNEFKNACVFSQLVIQLINRNRL